MRFYKAEIPSEKSLNLLRANYLTLMKNALTGILWEDYIVPLDISKIRTKTRRFLLKLLAIVMKRWNVKLMQELSFAREQREVGRDWPYKAFTMIGLKRLDNIQMCIDDVLANNVPGDFIETGVWRGGATIFMRAALKAYGVTDRKVWVADSFEGLPEPDPIKYPEDAEDIHHTFAELRASLEEVKDNFRRFDLLDEQVQFLKGLFKDTLPIAPIDKLAVIRLDGDMYESTIDAIKALYPRLSPGGYVIIDDYSASACRKAIQDYRDEHRINDEIMRIDWSGVYWKSSGN